MEQKRKLGDDGELIEAVVLLGKKKRKNGQVLTPPLWFVIPTLGCTLCLLATLSMYLGKRTSSRNTGSTQLPATIFQGTMTAMATALQPCSALLKLDGDKLVFGGSIDGRGYSFISDVTTGQTCRPLGTQYSYAPAWSPNGRQLAAHVYKNSKTNVVLTNADGSNQVRLEEAGATDPNMPILWSPDGSRLLYTSDHYELVYFHISSRERHLVTSQQLSVGNSHYDWSPDGQQIVFNSEGQGESGVDRSEIFIVNADGSNVRQLTSNTYADYAPDWSPDGKQITFTAQISSRTIFTMNSDGSNGRQLTDSTLSGARSQWSPDGQRLCFVGVVQGQESLFVMNADGSDSRFLMEGASPAWAPDSQQLALINIQGLERHLYLISMQADSEARWLHAELNFPVNILSVQWRPHVE